MQETQIIARMTEGTLPRAFSKVCQRIWELRRSIVTCISVCFYVHLTADGKQTAHDRHLLQSVMPLATFPVGPQQNGFKIVDLWRCVER